MTEELHLDGRRPLLEQLFGNRPSRNPPAIILDFDGTLAPIVAHPPDARLSPDVRAALKKLARLAPVAVVSGRSLADLRLRCRGLGPLHLVGNHGLEDERDLHSHVERERLRRQVGAWKDHWIRRSMESSTGALPVSASIPFTELVFGVVLEDKTYSLSIHHRNAPDRKRALAWIGATIASLDPPARVIPGKDVWNILPLGHGNKGTAVARLLSEAGAAGAVFFGDDDTDEDAFRLPEPTLATVLVGGRPETAARFSVPDVHAVARALARIARELAHPPS